jgi:predicted dehydrogenase
MPKIRIGIIGYGTIGSAHADLIARGEVSGAELTAVCTRNPVKLKEILEKYDKQVKTFDNKVAFFSSGAIDAVIIATPHAEHPSLAIGAFEAGLHVLTEKPAGVHIRQAREMNEAAAASAKVFSIMYNQRTNPCYRKLKEMIETGKLGGLKRINWIATAWYRPQYYYDSEKWRGTWAGEGGGVLLNQALHQIDLMQWLIGMPKRLRAFCKFGGFHQIEVEDEATLFLEYENGATGVFVASTSDAPGTNRLEITGDMGKIVIEDDQMTFWALSVSESRFNKEYQGMFGMPDIQRLNIDINEQYLGHKGIIQNWVEAILYGKPLSAPGQEGLNALQIVNAAYLSSWTDDWIPIPVDEELYLEMLQKKIAGNKH